MITKILLDRLLKPDHFLRASSQAGPYIGQPVPDVGNTGFMRLVSSGDENDQISNFEYTGGQASANGSQVSLVDSRLRVFGDSLLVGATVTLTSGASSGEARSVTAFTAALGTLYWSGAVSSTLSGDSYSLTLDYSNRSFIVKLLEGGDTGEAGFIWSHDGTQYFSREDPATSYWRAGTTICNDFYSWFYSIYGPTPPYSLPLSMPVLQANNGSLIIPYCRDASNQVLVEISNDNGLSWSTVNTGFSNSTRGISDGIVLKSGRILVVGGSIGIEFITSAAGYSAHMYSDDNGTTWKKQYTYGTNIRPDIYKLIELNNGNLLGIDRNYDNYISIRVSSDGGTNWGEGIQVHASASSAYSCDIVQTNNKNILLVYYTNELDPGTTYSIRGSISDDNGATWGTVTNILTSNNNLILPCLTRDSNGDIFCAFVEQIAGSGSSIKFVVSSDNGVSWGASRLLASNENHTLHYPSLGNINGHEIVCSYIDDIVGSTSAVFCRVGRSSDYTLNNSNYIPCSSNLTKHRLINDVAIQWYGGEGEIYDLWTFGPKHHYSMDNIIANSPKKVWRSTVDSVTCELIIDMGTNNVFNMDSIAFFDCNINTCSVQMNGTDVWAAPAIDKSVSFTWELGSVDSVTGQYITDSSLVSQYSPHELGDGNYRLIMTSGASIGAAYNISDNVGYSIIVDTTAQHGIAQGDSFSIFNGRKYDMVTADGFYRYIRIYIPAQETPEGYYQIGTAILGNTTTFTNTFADNGYSRQNDYNTDFLRSLSKTMHPVVHGDRSQKWSVSWLASSTSRKEMQAIATHARGRNMAFIPDWFQVSGGGKSSTTDVYLVKQVGTIRENFRYKNRWDLSVDFEENI